MYQNIFEIISPAGRMMKTAIVGLALIVSCTTPRYSRQVCTSDSDDQIINETKMEQIAEERCIPLYNIGSTRYLECIDQEITRISSSTIHRYQSSTKCRNGSE